MSSRWGRLLWLLPALPLFYYYGCARVATPPLPVNCINALRYFRMKWDEPRPEEIRAHYEISLEPYPLLEKRPDREINLEQLWRWDRANEVMLARNQVLKHCPANAPEIKDFLPELGFYHRQPEP